jgi:hypothetical protein
MKTRSPSKAQLRFDPDKHQYFLGDKRLPGVTSILQKVGLSKDFTGIDPFYAERGKAVHLAIQYALEGRLDEASLDPVIVPYFEGFKKYRAEHPIPHPRCEVLGSFGDEFCGIIDCITDDEIIDWKCSKSHDKVAELQGEAYKWIEASMSNPPGLEKFLPFKVVQFPGDGSYEIFDYGDKASRWPSVMDLYRWKMGK